MQFKGLKRIALVNKTVENGPDSTETNSETVVYFKLSETFTKMILN